MHCFILKSSVSLDIVDGHEFLRIHVLQIPLEALALESISQLQSLGNISNYKIIVLKEVRN